MKLRALVLAPFGIVALLFAALAVTDPAHHAIVIRIEIESAKLLALYGCVAAARAFEPGDYLRRAWLLSGSCYLFLLVRDVALGHWTPWAPAAQLGGVPVEVFESALVLLANTGAVLGTLMLARAWQVAGLDPAMDATRRRLLFVGTLAVALLIVGSNAIADARAVAHGQLGALVTLSSDAGDIISLALIAPLLSTALALRGGVLLWPWSLLTASMVGWLMYDVMISFGHVMAAPVYVRLAGEIFRSLACSFCFSAGVAQRLVIGQRARTDAPARAAAA